MYSWGELSWGWGWTFCEVKMKIKMGSIIQSFGVPHRGEQDLFPREQGNS